MQVESSAGPFINTAEKDPDWDTEFHFEVTLTLDELERLGVIEPLTGTVTDTIQ